MWKINESCKNHMKLNESCVKKNHVKINELCTKNHIKNELWQNEMKINES